MRSRYTLDDCWMHYIIGRYSCVLTMSLALGFQVDIMDLEGVVVRSVTILENFQKLSFMPFQSSPSFSTSALQTQMPEQVTIV